ncbi:Protein FAM169B [Amphibalanus amphitrite]|uniref:Protein FAM169B n=1 Tax=Amphibalanus amphitrite TaxID=1232801 RepID=A0A6A4X233_AMPAM|nr:Protein FAM169B [Amphibalanus amphitrite]
MGHAVIIASCNGACLCGLLLRDTQRRGPGWHRVTSLADRAALYLLLVYIYGERERSAARREPALRPPPPGDSALLLFAEDGSAVGCATLKRRGQLLRERAGPERFQMDILDTVFVRCAARRSGRTLALLEKLAGAAARLGRQLGVTRPTPAMRRLLRAFLAGRPWARDLLFEVTWAAGVHNRTNIWEQLVADGAGEGPEGAAPSSSSA